MWAVKILISNIYYSEIITLLKINWKEKLILQTYFSSLKIHKIINVHRGNLNKIIIKDNFQDKKL